MSYEEYKNCVPAGEEFIKLSKERQDFWVKFLLSGGSVFDEVIKLRRQMNNGTLEEMHNLDLGK